jgi:ABC-type multidrug transport system permease subunit
MTSTPPTTRAAASAAVGAEVAGVLGGLCWLARAVLDGTGGPASVVDGLFWGGLALVVVALLGIGAALVSGIAALRVLVAVCLTALAWSLLAFLHGQYADTPVDAVAGTLLALGCAAGLLRARRARPRAGGRRAVAAQEPGRRRAHAR